MRLPSPHTIIIRWLKYTYSGTDTVISFHTENTHIHTYTHTHIHTYTYTYIHTYTHTYTDIII